MFETIVWATDGSELADGALERVKELVTIHGSKVVAVHADELLAGRYGVGAPLRVDEPDVREKVARQVEELRLAGIDAQLEIPMGSQDAATLVARAADDVGADLIVAGTRGHGAVAAAVAGGSVARGLTHKAHCPVLIVPPRLKVAV